MPRRSRVVVAGMPHHIVQRGNHRLDVFRDEADRFFYRSVVAESCAMYGLRIRGYSLMTNHVHYIAVPERPDSIHRLFHRAHGLYANWFNRKYGFVGHLWQERPFSCVLSAVRLRNALRYVENNPVRAGMVSSATDYRWSSARAHCWGDPDPLLDSNEPRAIAGWDEWLVGAHDPIIDDLIRECTFTGLPCGDEAFVTELEQLTGRNLRPQKPGRKPAVTEVAPSLDFAGFGEFSRNSSRNSSG